jgi:hypothetical protein
VAGCHTRVADGLEPRIIATRVAYGLRTVILYPITSTGDSSSHKVVDTACLDLVELRPPHSNIALSFSDLENSCSSWTYSILSALRNRREESQPGDVVKQSALGEGFGKVLTF